MKLASIALTILSMTAVLNADVWNKKTIITVSESMQIPGKLLPPGTYVLKLVDSQSNRHIVQVMNEAEDKVEATIIAIPNLRLQPTGKSSFGFWETPAGTPRALRSWFYPGDSFGQEFAYPKDMAASLSSMTKEKVPALADESGANGATTAAASTPAQETAPVETAKAEPVAEPAPAAVPTPEPTPAPVATPTPEPTPAPAAVEAPSAAPQAAAQTSTPSALPATASPLAAIALGGLLLVSAGKSLSVYAKRS